MNLSLKMLVAAGMLAFFSLQNAAAAAPKMQCLSADEADALNMRVLQTDLMVSGLACKLHNDYAAFVQKQKASLARHATIMSSYFKRTTGNTNAMDKFVTGLANASSTQSLQMKENRFCEQAKALFAEVNELKERQLLEKLAATPDIVVRRGVPICTQTAKK